VTALDLGINSDSINYEVALEKLGQSRQPWMTEIRLERAKAMPSQVYIDYCTAQLAALDQLQGDLEPRDLEVVTKILDGSLFCMPQARRDARGHGDDQPNAGPALPTGSKMKPWLRDKFSDVDRARRAVLTFAASIGTLGFLVSMGALLLASWKR
jgi:hypothetical protein